MTLEYVKLINVPIETDPFPINSLFCDEVLVAYTTSYFGQGGVHGPKRQYFVSLQFFLRDRTHELDKKINNK